MAQLLPGGRTDKDNRTYYFCTYFDRHYLARGLALYQSLKQHCPAFRLWVLCLDDETCVALTQLSLPEVQLIALPDFERGDEELLLAKRNRSLVEYYFTCTPSLPLFVMNHNPEVDLITYLDADLFFFSSPAPLFDELGTNSIAIIGHRFTPTLKDLERHGIYNVGWLSFRRDVNGLACLRWWRDRCIEWCYDRVEGDKYADQKYLDKWPTLFQRVVVLQHKGANLAPWNLANYCLQCQNGDAVMIDNQPLIFFHFHRLKRVTSWWYNPSWAFYAVTPSMVLRRRVYMPYIQTLFDIGRQLSPTFAAHPVYNSTRGRQVSRMQRVLGGLRSLPSVAGNILTGRYIFTANGHVI